MTTYTQIASGTNTTLYDASPFAALTAGEGAPGVVRAVEDFVAIPRTGFGTAGNFFRLLRFPSNARIKRLELYTDLLLVDGGTSSSALSVGVGVVFSDSTIDGTPAALQNQMPTTVGIGGGTTTAGTSVAVGGTSSNRLFGNILANTSTGAFPNGSMGNIPSAAVTGQAAALYFGGEFTYHGTIATYGSPVAISQIPLVKLFNFRDAQNNLIYSSGFFDIILIADVIYQTQPAAGYNIYGRLEYVL